MNLLDFIDSFPVEEGSHTLTCGDYYLDVLFQGNGVYEKSDYVLVSFGGAISNRNKKIPPFYTCMNLSKEVDLPLISISDPSLNLSDDFSLGWYAGNQYQRGLPYDLAEFFDDFIKKTGKKIIFIGGSGGGFAILSIHDLMKDENNSLSIVWNPQTNIIDYSLGHANRYLKASFSDYEEGDRDCASSFLKDNVRCEIFRNDNKKTIIFMDGYDHNHLRLHLKPWLGDRVQLKKDGNFLIYDNLVVYIGDWGVGHTPPPKDYLCFTVKKAIENRINDIIWKLNFEHKKPLLKIDDPDHLSILEKLDIRGNFFNSGINIVYGINEFFIGYQMSINILHDESNRVLARTGWLKNYHDCQCFFDLSNVSNILNGLVYEVCIHDFFGHKYILKKYQKNMPIYNYSFLKAKV